MTSLYAAGDGWYPKTAKKKAKAATYNPYVVWAIAVWLILGVFWTVNKKMKSAEKAHANQPPSVVQITQQPSPTVAMTAF